MGRDITLREFARMGGDATKKKHGSDHFKKIGNKGPDALRKKYGDEYFKNLAKKGMEARRRKKELEQTEEIIDVFLDDI